MKRNMERISVPEFGKVRNAQELKQLFVPDSGMKELYMMSHGQSSDDSDRAFGTSSDIGSVIQC